MARAYAIRVGTIPSNITAPTAPFTLGTQVGVPTGTSLTTSSGLGTNDGTESLTLTHPVTGSQKTFDVTVYRRRKWTATIGPNPAAGAAYLFDECEFNVLSDNFVVDADTATNGRSDIMWPLVVFRRCTFNGGDLTGTALVGGFLWVIDSHLTGCENGISGGYWTVVTGSNVIATTDSQPDPHADGLQVAGIGQTVVYHSWMDAGDDSASANAPIRIGTEFSAVTNIDIRYTGLAGTQHGLQMRGDAGAGDISGVTVIGCRWADTPVYGYTDFAETTSVTWSDNATVGGTTIPNPVP